MEQIILIAFGLVLFWEYGGDTKDQIWFNVKNNPRGAIKYFGAAAVFTAFISLLPSLIMSSYMKDKGFFALEVYGDQKDGFKIAALRIAFDYLIMTIYLFISILTFLLKSDALTKITSCIISLFVFIFMLALYSENGQISLFFAFLLLSTATAFYIAFLITKKFEEKFKLWWVPLVVTGVILAIPLFWPKFYVNLAEDSLRRLRLGGITVEVYESLENTEKVIFKGLLLLRTTDFYYIKPESKNDEIVIINTEGKYIKYHNITKD